MDRTATLGTSRKNTSFRMTEQLEPRRLFDASPIAAAGAELEFVPVVGPFVIHAEFDASHAPHEIRFTFNEDVWASLDPSDLVLVNSQQRFDLPEDRITINWDFATNTASFVFVRLDDGGVLPEGDWRASLNSEGVFNSEGQPLDGDGDHLPGGDFRFDFSFIRGDANIDGAVDLTDLGVLAANFGQVNRNFNEGDFNYDNIVDLKDFQLFASRFGGSPNSGGDLGIVPSGSGLRQQDPAAGGLIGGNDELV